MPRMNPPQDAHEITRLLDAWGDGNRWALDELMPLVAAELRRLAKNYMLRERPSHTLEPTALVNELYLRLVGRRDMNWKDRAHFFAFSATTMRRILVDHARGKRTSKRGDGIQWLPLDEAMDQPQEMDLIALDDALKTLEAMRGRQVRIIELRCFTGLKMQEIAELLEISLATANREWASARAWLYRELNMRERA